MLKCPRYKTYDITEKTAVEKKGEENMSMSELSEIKPAKKPRIMDLVSAAGVDVSNLANGKGGKEKAASNPKYCYEW